MLVPDQKRWKKKGMEEENRWGLMAFAHAVAEHAGVRGKSDVWELLHMVGTPTLPTKNALQEVQLWILLSTRFALSYSKNTLQERVRHSRRYTATIHRKLT